MVLFCPGTFATQCEAASGEKTIEFEGKQWVTDLADRVTVEEYRGTTALCVRGRNDSYVYLPDVEFQDGTIEVDIAIEPRSVPGIGFRGRDDGKWYDKIMIDRRRGEPRDPNEMVEQAVVTRRNGTLVLLRVGTPRQDGLGKKPDLYEWFHLKVAIRGKDVKVYLNGNEEPSIEVGGMFDDIGRGTLGVCGRDFYFANFRYTSSVHGAPVHDRIAGERDY